MTKPITGAAALTLVADGTVGLDDAVDRLLPELADRRVMRDPDGSIDDTVPAEQPITLRHLLTFTLGIGMDFTRFGQQPVLQAAEELELGSGPPQPQGPPPPDEWMRRLGSLPLEAQPGERWLYHVGADVLGVLVAARDREVAGGRARRSGARTARDGRHAVLGARRLARPLWRLLRPRPELGRALDVRRGGRPVEPAARRSRRAVPGSCRRSTTTSPSPGCSVPAGATTARRWSPPSWSRDDDEPADPAQLAASGPDPSGDQGFGFCVGVLRKTTPTGATRAPMGGAAASGATGTRTPSTTRSGSCSPTRCSTAPSCRRSARSCSGRDRRTERVEVGEDRRCRALGRIVGRVDVEAVDVDQVMGAYEALDRDDICPLVPRTPLGRDHSLELRIESHVRRTGT